MRNIQIFLMTLFVCSCSKIHTNAQTGSVYKNKSTLVTNSEIKISKNDKEVVSTQHSLNEYPFDIKVGLDGTIVMGPLAPSQIERVFDYLKKNHKYANGFYSGYSTDHREEWEKNKMSFLGKYHDKDKIYFKIAGETAWKKTMGWGRFELLRKGKIIAIFDEHIQLGNFPDDDEFH